MKILITTAWYHPFIHPRAHRWTALAEYWAGQGHEIHVVSARHRSWPDESTLNGVLVHRTGFDSLKEVVYYYCGKNNGRGRVGATVRQPGLFGRLAAWMYNAIWKKVYFPDDACIWYFPAKRKVRQLLEKEQFDVVITVSLPFTAHLIGLRLRNLGGFVNGIPPIWLAASRLRNFKNFVNVASNDRHKFFWLADIGDPFSIQAKSLNNSFLYGKWSRRLEQIVLESADAVTVTTEFTLQEFRERFGQKATEKMFVVPPLLHPPPPIRNPQSAIRNPQSAIRNPQSAIRNPQSPIRIGYFGALYAPVRTPDALLDLLEKTFALKPDMKGRLEAHFYGEIFPEFYERLTAQPAVRLHGLRSRSEVQRAMSEMDILVNIGNTTDFQLPSKVVDYLASGKPVVNLSYTDTDPFASFFGDNNLILNLKVENGRVGEKEVRRWLTWLEEEKKMPDKADLERLIAPYLVESVAASYLRWMKTGQPFSPQFPE